MKILQVSPDFYPYAKGASTFKLLAEAWTDAGHEVTIVSSVPKRLLEENPPETLTFNTTFVRLLDGPGRISEASYFLPIVSKDKQFLHSFVKKELRTFDLIIVHGILESVSRYFLKAIAELGVTEKVLVTDHGIPKADYDAILRMASNIAYKTWGNKILKPYRNIVVFSNNSRDEHLKYFSNYPSRSVSVIPLGINLREFTEKVKAVSSKKEEMDSWYYQAFPRTEKLIVAIGRHDRVKGYGVLIEAFHRLNHMHDGLVLIIAGKKTEFTVELLNLVAEKNLSNKVFLVDRVDEAKKIYLMLRSDVFVIPSLKEGYGLNAAEAAILDLPTVATKVGAHKELLAQSMHAKLIPPNSVNELASALTEFLNEGGFRNEWEIKDNPEFDIRNTARMYLELFRQK